MNFSFTSDMIQDRSFSVSAANRRETAVRMIVLSSISASRNFRFSGCEPRRTAEISPIVYGIGTENDRNVTFSWSHFIALSGLMIDTPIPRSTS
jgi:hypothetical protein